LEIFDYMVQKTREIELFCQFVDEWIERVALKTSKGKLFSAAEHGHQRNASPVRHKLGNGHP
jgi:hypothetical protein